MINISGSNKAIIKKNKKYWHLYCRNGINNQVNTDNPNISFAKVIIYGQIGGQAPDCSKVSSPFVIVKTSFLIST